MTCHTCKYAILTLPFAAECNKTINDEPVHEDWWCPEELTCSYWEQASEGEIKTNSISWGEAPIIRVD